MLTISPVEEYGLSLDLEEMGELVNLQKFIAENCKIADISPLETLTNLTELRLYKNNVTDISALTNLRSLEILTLRGNLISDYLGQAIDSIPDRVCQEKCVSFIKFPYRQFSKLPVFHFIGNCDFL